eukprot:1395953-Amphidinium_carterae.1
MQIRKTVEELQQLQDARNHASDLAALCAFPKEYEISSSWIQNYLHRDFVHKTTQTTLQHPPSTNPRTRKACCRDKQKPDVDLFVKDKTQRGVHNAGELWTRILLQQNAGRRILQSIVCFECCRAPNQLHARCSSARPTGAYCFGRSV